MKKLLLAITSIILFVHSLHAQQQCNPGTIACIDTLATNVAVVSVSGTYSFEDTCVWACSGITAALANGPSGHGLNNVYVESNATVTISSSINGILAKAGATVNLQPGSTATLVVCEPGANIRQNGNPWSGNCTCNEVVFDYTYAPTAQECMSTGIKPAQANRVMQVYPNPADDRVNIQLNDFTEKDEVILWNALGIKLNSFRISNRQLTISTSFLQPGVYSITAIHEGKEMVMERLVVSR